MVLGIFYQKKQKKQRKEDTRRKNKKINTKKPMVLNKKSPKNSEDIKIII